MMGYDGYGLMGGVGGFGMVIGILFWIGLIALAIWGANRLFSVQGRGVGDSALEILKQRYARGEITGAEFQRARQDLV